MGKCEDQTNRVGLSGIKTIVGLDPSGTEDEMFSCYDVRDETKWWWHGCSDREYLIVMGADAGEVTAA